MEKDKVTIKKAFFYKLGIGLLITCIPFWIVPIIIPFTSLPVQIKAGLITGSIIIAEIIFWIGAILVGKEVINKIKNHLNPKKWRNKKGEQQSEKQKHSRTDK